jgi:putative endonuclease
MPCVYILYSEGTKKFYVGSSREESANNRLRSHNSGKSKSTKGGRPWRLVYEEYASDYTEARKKENYLKSGAGRRWFKENFKIMEGWPSGLRRRSCPPEAGPPWAEKPL